MSYIIKNKKYGNYFKKYLLGIMHFVECKEEATRFKLKKEANLTMRLFKHKDNFEIVKVSK